jgi:hypothetical protein
VNQGLSTGKRPSLTTPRRSRYWFFRACRMSLTTRHFGSSPCAAYLESFSGNSFGQTTFVDII